MPTNQKSGVHAGAMKPTALVLHGPVGLRMSTVHDATYSTRPIEYMTIPALRMLPARRVRGISTSRTNTSIRSTFSGTAIPRGMSREKTSGWEAPGSVRAKSRLNPSTGTTSQKQFRR